MSGCIIVITTCMNNTLNVYNIGKRIFYNYNHRTKFNIRDTSKFNVLDEMSMIKNIILCMIEQCLKQCFQNDVDFFNFILVLLVGDLSQLPPHLLNGSGKYRI
jgi:hypothetical protein